ncbi:MAG: cyclic nucleotide-binding domain-containing protein [Fimbriimonadaceae bacterium]|nr:cyclic nucleotide-binding domain-containing protein [Chthonomonadaceae bacterium]MCO5296842.1 cyclic nucleotide-binding domain-containing protein [Fimbriimonadaceae bacterium]
MSSDDTLEMLRRAGECPLFDGLGDPDMERLLAMAERKSFADGAPVVRHGERGSELMVILAGRCEVRNSMHDLITVLEAGALLGEVGFIDGEGRSANVLASGPAEVLAFREGLLDALRDTPELRAQFVLNLAKILCQKLRATTRLAEASFV